MLKKIFNFGKDKEEEDQPKEVANNEESSEEEAGLFGRLKKGLSKTRRGFVSQIQGLFKGYSSINEELFEDLEEILIQADVGVHTTMKLVENLKERADEEKIKDPSQLMGLLKDELTELLNAEGGIETQDKPTVLMVVGVNGVGKTTTIGKIAKRAKNANKKVLLAAGDTFRAAAIEQLQAWAAEVGTELISHQEGADAAAVAYDAVQAAKSRDNDLLIVDTAGRLHTQENLMEELKKVKKVITREAGDEMRVEVLLVLDATTGQNAVSQAKKFDQAVDVDGIALTKLDGTAKGGVVISVTEELDIPIKLIGVGEDVADLQDFEVDSFIAALFDERALTA
ncbi:signal recognition particle-docking protein FtsY [Halobacteroides halobius DSM 5150]|uniref:Signal recognition particle receptor FtsY n=1 Tax=Halobacteroides halobius (strain ATCC 35273 / DSM 5150 / MD-1) TaxID=748449 RepID=L0K6E2_HALHC|nr:signal recognition particle-docking protein FtsY [Halobacteroides halobius]AGB40596.1 signal recognition particle-docking protein FtsY [Halobacteroides halobius DSM 5150]